MESWRVFKKMYIQNPMFLTFFGIGLYILFKPAIHGIEVYEIEQIIAYPIAAFFVALIFTTIINFTRNKIK